MAAGSRAPVIAEFLAVSVALVEDMGRKLASDEWARGRGDKWLAQLLGMEAMLAPVDEPLIHVLDLDGPLRIADIGCGGGGTTLAIQRRAPAGSVVDGFDISEALIAAANDRLHDDQAVSFARADVATVAAPDEPYDRVVSRFGTMFYDDAPAAFSNLFRWLVPGGRFAFAVWGNPTENLWNRGLREVLAEFVEISPPAREGPGPFRYAAVDKLLGVLEQAGFADLEVKDWRGKLPVGGGLPADEAARFALAAFAVAEAVAEAGDEVFASAREALTARFAQDQQGQVVLMDAHVHLCTGIRPQSR